MNGFGIIASIIIGAVAGWIASLIMRTGAGLFLDIVLGIVGGFIGNFVFGLIDVAPKAGSVFGTIITSVVGACILLAVINLIKR